MLHCSNLAHLRLLALPALLALSMGCAAWQSRGEPLGARLGPYSRYVHTLDNRSVYVEIRGENTERSPVLLVHGFASNHDVWDTLEPSLSATRRTLNIDLPGFGWSTRSDGDYSPQALARDLLAVLDAAGAPTVDLVAHSWGSSVALSFALEHPSRVRRLVLLGAWVYDEQIPPFFRWAHAPLLGEALFTGFYAERPGDRFPMAFEDPEAVSQEMVDLIERSFDRPGTSRAALAAARGQCFLQLERQYRSIAHPTLLLWGQNDNVSRPRFGERLAREMPHARMIVVPGVGHFPMIEAQSSTREAVLAFLDGANP